MYIPEYIFETLAYTSPLLTPRLTPTRERHNPQASILLDTAQETRNSKPGFSLQIAIPDLNETDAMGLQHLYLHISHRHRCLLTILHVSNAALHVYMDVHDTDVVHDDSIGLVRGQTASIPPAVSCNSARSCLAA